jgi:phage gp46-like protein
MAVGIDAIIEKTAAGYYDMAIGPDGDLLSGDTFDTAIMVSLFTDARADESEVPQRHRRRGWIGNESTPGVQMGSTLWTLAQTRVTKTLLNQIETIAQNALRWLVGDGYAKSVTSVACLCDPGIRLTVTIERTNSRVEQRFFDLWQNTGV